MNDEPLITMEKVSDFVWGFLRAAGVIFTLMAILWFLGKVHPETQTSDSLSPQTANSKTWS